MSKFSNKNKLGHILLEIVKKYKTLFDKLILQIPIATIIMT